MKKTLSIILLSVFALATGALAMAAPVLKATFSISKRTQVPGDTLRPGTFSIQILDHLTDRMVVRVEDATGRQQALFLAIPHPGLAGANTSGALTWKADLDGIAALRGFAFPSGYTVEFVYPKTQAAGLAKVNADRVVAIDPDSEGRPALRKMSSEDMQMITLWMLSLTTVGPQSKTPAILAERYESHAPAAVQMASTTPAEPTQGSSRTVASPPPAQVAKLVKPDVASGRAISPKPVNRRPAISSLPHTASNLPLVLLIGLLSLFGVGLVRARLGALSTGR